MTYERLIPIQEASGVDRFNSLLLVVIALETVMTFTTTL